MYYSTCGTLLAILDEYNRDLWSDTECEFPMARILVVDDDRAIAQMLADYIEMCGFQAAIEPDGLRALQHVDLRRPDLLILDLMLPVVNGVEVARRLRQDPESRDIPILAITAVENSEDISDVLMVDRIMSKPLDLELLGAEIHSLLSEANDPPDEAAKLPADYVSRG
ncbi:MAG: response regulator [Thermomicrobiaceae bacterium]